MNIYTQYALHVFTYVTKTYDYMHDIMKITVQGIYDAHTPSMWIFSKSNSYPLILNTKWAGDLENATIYYPNTHTFYKETTKKISMDIALASIKESNGDTIDISLFLYKLSWDSTYIPSLYEIILLYYMHSNTYVPHELLETYKVNILTSDVEVIEVALSSSFAKEPFKGWSGELKID